MSRPMKHSGVDWLGDIPADWSVTRIKYFYDCYDGRRVPVDSAERRSGPYPYWGAGSITDYVDDYLFDEELVLLGEDGAPFFDHTRPVAFLVNEKVWVNNHIHVLKPKPTVNSRFLVHWLNNVDYKSYINGSILNKLTQSNMNSIAFAFPPLDEQQRIAAFLDDKCSRIDSVIEKTRATVDEYKKLKQSIITRAVTKGIRPNRNMKDSGVEWLGDIPDDWELVSIGRLFNISAGGDAKPEYYSDTQDEEHPYPVYTNSMNKNQVYAYTSKPIYLANTITVTGRGAIGTAFYRNTPYDAIIRLLSLSPKLDLDCRFYAYWISNVIHFFTDSAAIGQLSAVQMSSYKTAYCSKNEQQEIAAYLDEKTAAIDSLIAKKIQLAEELEQLKKSLIFEYVTGKKEL